MIIDVSKTVLIDLKLIDVVPIITTVEIMFMNAYLVPVIPVISMVVTAVISGETLNVIVKHIFKTIFTVLTSSITMM